MKEWRCIVVTHHDDVGRAIVEWEAQGWHLHSYNTAGMGRLELSCESLFAFERGQ